MLRRYLFREIVAPFLAWAGLLFVLFFGYAATGAVVGILGWGKPPKQALATAGVGDIHGETLDDGGDDLHEIDDSDDAEGAGREEPLVP